MHIEYHKRWSTHLNRDMEFKIYGHAGKPFVVFPSGGGKFYEFEDFGMVEAGREFIDQGKVRLVTVDSVDSEAWLGFGRHPADRGWRHHAYDLYVVEDLVPFIRTHLDTVEQFMTTGCSMGAGHAVNFLFRHPDVFDGVIAMSGLYGPWYFVGDYVDDNVYFNFPLLYLPNLEDPWYLERFRQSAIMICVGQGAWEEDHVRETRALEAVLRALDVPALVDYWGYDVNHDWPWWQKQFPYFLEKLPADLSVGVNE
ncbi:MAG: esterase family protein [Anaerolineae bacterium]|nr:esterase family protein [Anaerolineae bacterium]